jgi:hypothetical protein
MSTVPAVVAALVTLAEATFDSDDWQVIDGPANTVTTVKQQVIAIGHEPIVTTRSLTDQYTVPCLVSVALPGPDSLPTARTAAIGAYESLRAAIRAQEDLNTAGAIRVQVADEHELQQFADEQVRSAAIRFGVFVMAQSDGPF